MEMKHVHFGSDRFPLALMTTTITLCDVLFIPANEGCLLEFAFMEVEELGLLNFTFYTLYTFPTTVP